MKDNFDMKQFLTENKLGPYAKAKVKEDMGHDIEDAEAEKQMDFLAEKPVKESMDLNKIQSADDKLRRLISNISTNSNIPTADKEGLLNALSELQDFVDEVGFDAEVEQDQEEPVSDYSRRRQNELSEESVRMFKSDNPEGDKLVLGFLKRIAKDFDYPVAQAAMFVKERIKKLGY